MVNDQGDTSACCKYDTRNTFAILPALCHTDHDVAKLLTWPKFVCLPRCL